MSSFDPRSHTFIIRIWVEPREIEGTPVQWRGEIKHVPSGKTVFFQRLETLPERLEHLVHEAEHG
jgi:hypothetical protein